MTLQRYSKLFANKIKNPIISDKFIKNYVPKVFQRFLLPEQRPPLGRWNIPKKIVDEKEEYCYDKIHDKANMANYDHCDPCGNEFPPNNFENNKKNKK
jgi:hypothetical protein